MHPHPDLVDLVRVEVLVVCPYSVPRHFVPQEELLWNIVRYVLLEYVCIRSEHQPRPIFSIYIVINDMPSRIIVVDILILRAIEIIIYVELDSVSDRIMVDHVICDQP